MGAIGFLMVISIIVAVLIIIRKSSLFLPTAIETVDYVNIFSVKDKSANNYQEYQTFRSIYFLLRTCIVSLFSLSIFALFSYPEEILVIKIGFIIIFACIAKETIPCGRPQFLKKKYFYILIIPIPIMFAVSFGYTNTYLMKLQEAKSEWKDALSLYYEERYHECVESYLSAYKYFRNNPDYLLNYAKALSLAGKHNEAIEIINKNHLNNTVAQTTLGDSYKVIGAIRMSENAYIKAWNMAPNRFYPRHLLAQLYIENGERDKAVRIAKELLAKKIKVKSKAIEEILQEMKKIIELYG